MLSLSAENLKKPSMENVSCSTSGLRVKWKPRKLSAVRDFPVGCGRDCLPVSLSHLEAVVPVIYTDCKVESSVPGAAIEAIDNGVERMLMMNDDGVGVLNAAVDDGGTENYGVGLAGETKEVAHGVKLLATAQELNSCRNNHQAKFPKRRVSVNRDFPPFCGWNAPAPSEDENLKIAGNSSLAVGYGVSETMKSTEVVIVDGEMSAQDVGDRSVKKNQLSQNKCSEVMDKGRAGSLNLTEDMIMGGEGAAQDVRGGYVMENQLSQNKSSVAVDKGGAGNSKITIAVIVGGEVFAQDDTVKKSQWSEKVIVNGLMASKNCPWRQGKQGHAIPHNSMSKSPLDNAVCLESEQDRVIVQGLMASANCPWGQGQKGHTMSRSPLDDADDFECEMDERVIVHGLMASESCPWGQGQQGHTTETKSHNVMTRSQVKMSAFTTPIKSKETKFAGGGKSGERKSKSAGKVAGVGTFDLVVRNQENIVANNEKLNEDSHNVQGKQEFGDNLSPFVPKSSSDARNRVRETLRLFQAAYRKILQEEESKTSQGDEIKPKQNKRIDLAAAKIVQEKGKEVNAGNRILGAVPGVEVGDEFQYRVELALIGVHRLYQAGIDYIMHGDRNDKVASSIVASGGYDDDLENSDVLIYSGSGGVGGKGKEPEDQKLERGNLALKNSISLKNPVRVIRGWKETTKVVESSDFKSKLVTTYVYDGLYTVERYWQDPVGPKGSLVFKFELRRIPGQPELAWKEVKKSRRSKIRQGLCVDDISGGKELIPICAVNTIDDEKPPAFNYINKMIYPEWYNPTDPTKGCDCTKQCYDKTCKCASKNGGEIPYNRNGAIVEIKPIVYECGPSCKCPPSCYNRVTQHGIKIQLEIFKTKTRGWGVRSLNSIPSGSFICEYIGELIEDVEAEKRTGNDEYLFDIGQNYTDSSVNLEAKPTSCESVEEGGFTIDAAKYGNVGRFVNHSCSPNLYAQNVLFDQEDKRMPHIMLFAVENIPPLQELTYHYNYAVDTVRDSNGNIKIKKCFCGSGECTGRMY